MKENHHRKILIAPLNWGLGHATRMVPVIDQLQAKGMVVVLASSGLAGQFLQGRYPGLTYYELTDYGITYSRRKAMVLTMLKSVPAMRHAIEREQRELAEIVDKTGINITISDNRYGCFHPGCRSIIVTHQLRPIAPGGFKIFQPLIDRAMKKFLQPFDECWVPDMPDQRLSGKLSAANGVPIPVQYVGWLSRFASKVEPAAIKYDWLAILSGPEPQRSLLEEKFMHECRRINAKGAILAGKPDGSDGKMENDIMVFPHCPDNEFLQLISESRCLLMRPGYSSLMDMARIGRSALLVPTPGQTEQAYLAERIKPNGGFVVQQQSDLDLAKAALALQQAEAPKAGADDGLLAARLNALLG